MIASAVLNFEDKIVYLSFLHENRVAIVDKTHNFSIIQLPSMEVIQSFTLKHAYTHSEKKNICFSPDGKYLAYSEKEQSVVRVIDIQKQTLYHSFPTLKNHIETLSFSPNSHYLVAGSVTGRVYLWNIFSPGQVARLSSFPEYSTTLLPQTKINYVSAASFSSSGHLVATSGYGGSIVITNIHTEVLPKRITPSHVRINSLCFINETYLAAGNIEGGITMIDLQNAQIHKHYQSGLGDINTMCPSHSGHYLFVAGHSTKVSLIDLKAQKILFDEYLKLPSKVTRLDRDEQDLLVVGCEDGSVHFFHLFPEDLFKLRLNTASYAQCYDLLNKFPLLQESELVHELDIAWEKTLEEAISQVEQEEYSGAQRVLKRFDKVASKVAIINEFQGLYTHYVRFKTAVKHENFAMAYSMADHIPLLKRTEPYQEMEAIWDKAFLKAQAYVIKSDTHRLFKVLEPFSRVGAKLCFIQVLLHQPEMFMEFTQHINDHSYDKIFSITKQYPCLKQIESYKKVIESSEDLLDKFRQHIYSRDYELAELEQEALRHITYLKDELNRLSHLLELAKRLDAYYQDKQMISAYTLIDSHSELASLPLTLEIEKIWNEKMMLCEKEALLGHTKEIKHTLQELLTLHSRAQKIGTLLRLSYMTQIKFLVVKEQDSLISKAVYNYIKLFGYDTELDTLLQKLQKSKDIVISLSPEQKHRRPRTLWLTITDGKVPDTIIEDILV